MTTTPGEPVSDEDITTTGITNGGGDADSTDGADADGTDGDATDTSDGGDADGTDA